jgi:maltose/moltooligosaccharide transporter
VRLRLPRRRRADSLRTKPSASIAACTLSRVRSLTWSGWLSTLDTVPSETPARGRRPSCSGWSLSIAQSAFGVESPDDPAYADAVSWTGLVNGWYNIVTFLVAFPLVALAKKRGAKLVHISCLLCASVGLLIFAGLSNKYLMFLPIIGLGIAWASIMGVPYIMAVRMIPSSRYGVYMGIINMMIVIPMLIQTVTFGAIYSSVLGDNPSNAIRFAGILLAVAGAAMLWIKEPPIVRDVDDVLEMPMGGGH